MYGPLRFTRTDLVASTIQRGRDFGLRSYADVRDALDLPPVETFEDLNPELSSSNPKVKPPKENLRSMPRRSVTLCCPRPVSCYTMLQTFIEETSQNWSSSPADFWSLSAARVRSFQPSSWTSLSGSGTGTVFGSRTGRTGTLPFNRPPEQTVGSSQQDGRVLQVVHRAGDSEDPQDDLPSRPCRSHKCRSRRSAGECVFLEGWCTNILVFTTSTC